LPAHTYELDERRCGCGTTDFGDDKDRVMRKSDGGYTYFVPDVAYHLEKWRRGFVRVTTSRARIITARSRVSERGLQALDIGIQRAGLTMCWHQIGDGA